jgi:hypothetical protein
MSIKKGSQDVQKIYLGDSRVSRVYHGLNLAWEEVTEPTLVTSISPTETVQNTIPFTVTLTNNDANATIYYRLGTGGPQYTYTGPFEVNQNSPYVSSPDILVTYWSANALETEAEKSITYDTRGAVPAKPTPVATVTETSVILNWSETANTTSYNVYRSTTLGTMGELLSQYQTDLAFTDNTIVGGTTYYYTVRSANYWLNTPSDQLEVVTTAPPAEATTNWRYVRFIGYGDQTNTATTRLVELKAIGGGTNYLLGKLPISGEAVNAGATIDKATDDIVSYESGSYPIWWMGEGIPTLVYDLGSSVALSTLQVWMYTNTWDPRQTRFMLHVSNDNANWTLVADMSANTVNQDPTNGWSYDAPINP